MATDLDPVYRPVPTEAPEAVASAPSDLERSLTLWRFIRDNPDASLSDRSRAAELIAKYSAEQPVARVLDDDLLVALLTESVLALKPALRQQVVDGIAA
jgi:hypothetical protein